MKLKLPPEDIESENAVLELDIGSIGEFEESRCSNYTSKRKIIQWKFLIMRNFLKIIAYQCTRQHTSRIWQQWRLKDFDSCKSELQAKPATAHFLGGFP